MAEIFSNSTIYLELCRHTELEIRSQWGCLGSSLEQMWQVYLDFKKRGGCSYLDRMYVPRLAIYAESPDGNKVKNGWIN